MDPNLFVDPSTAEDFICAICHLVVKDPIVEHIDCYRVFCKPCIEEFSSHTCPHCSSSTLDRLRPMHPKVYSQVYLKLEMKCSLQNCDSTIPLSQYDNHLSSCIHVIVPCSYCDKQIEVIAMEDHHAKDCMRYVIPCIIPGCREKIPRDEMDQHERDYYKHHNQLLLQRIRELEDLQTRSITQQQQRSQSSSDSTDDDSVVNNSKRQRVSVNANKRHPKRLLSASTVNVGSTLPMLMSSKRADTIDYASSDPDSDEAWRM